MQVLLDESREALLSRQPTERDRAMMTMLFDQLSRTTRNQER